MGANKALQPTRRSARLSWCVRRLGENRMKTNESPSGEQRNPKVFISYSWDSESHRAWVRALGARLRSDGVDVTLDQWHVGPGDQLPEFMERAIRENDFVLLSGH